MALEHAVQDGIARRYDYGDRTVLVADLGPGTDVSVEVVDGTAVVEASDGHRRELQLPPGDARAFNRNGVVSIEVRS